MNVPRNWATTAGPRHDDARPVRHEPVVIGVRGDVRAFVGVRPQIVDFRDTQLGERFGPNSQGSCRPLLLLCLQWPKRESQKDVMLQASLWGCSSSVCAGERKGLELSMSLVTGCRESLFDPWGSRRGRRRQVRLCSNRHCICHTLCESKTGESERTILNRSLDCHAHPCGRKYVPRNRA